MTPKSEKIRILVAEDHLVARVGVTTIVNMQPDMEVVAEASNGQQAVELYRQHRPDVTLLDLRMPGMGGVEAAVAIRAEFPKARMIALTTYGGDEDVRRALAAQMPRPDLSSREVEVLGLIVQGLANKQIAYSLGIAEHTVKNHVKSILAKLGAQDRTQAATVAIQRGIIHI